MEANLVADIVHASTTGLCRNKWLCVGGLGNKTFIEVQLLDLIINNKCYKRSPSNYLVTVFNYHVKSHVRRINIWIPYSLVLQRFLSCAHFSDFVKLAVFILSARNSISCVLMTSEKHPLEINTCFVAPNLAHNTTSIIQ
ncbi:hypothetical protein Fmac_021084 [Flemingia macrophylla]|uniref:Uncharacterized protein n=1 Tax=Flemingia macrophylla TaxID=520843 RepID=A0ABD1LVU4_9FABA